jgi:hypothetical protein
VSGVNRFQPLQGVLYFGKIREEEYQHAGLVVSDPISPASAQNVRPNGPKDHLVRHGHRQPRPAGTLLIRTLGHIEPSPLDVHSAQLNALNPKLIPLIAHDRAGFGGALLSDAAALLATALWGLQQGARWLWKPLLFGGAPGFIAGLSVHFEFGYTDFMHLLPAYAAVLLYVAGLILLYPYLMNKTAAA